MTKGIAYLFDISTLSTKSCATGSADVCLTFNLSTKQQQQKGFDRSDHAQQAMLKRKLVYHSLTFHRLNSKSTQSLPFICFFTKVRNMHCQDTDPPVVVGY